ncbi:transposase [Streptomyces radicis]|uniref:Transposase IS701-like DDE domain-containing protein n=1 Tax=Streptomyces radicis TaxID=1750517 RepID=A0ABX9RRA7_9ACTN|nr:transposase [Streptomyces radicis]RKN27788.1 hypothetical protein D7318_02635 [Streptomyces radicis]
MSRFRTDFYDHLAARATALLESTDAMLCTDGPVRSPVDLALAPEHRREHGARCGGLDQGRIDAARLRRAPAGAARASWRRGRSSPSAARRRRPRQRSGLVRPGGGGHAAR